MTLSLTSIVLLLLPILGCARPGVKVTLLGGEGLLIHSRDSTILVDAFVGARQTRGDPPRRAVRDAMLAGRAPFASVHLALVSHPHDDHFHATTAGTFLRKHPETLLASSALILQRIRDEYPESAAIEHQLREVEPEAGRVTTLQLPGMQVEFLSLAHEASVFYPERVLGHLIRLGERTVLVIGDAEMRSAKWQHYELESRGIDVALVPLWLFKEEIVRRVIEENIAPARVAVVQVPPVGLRETAAALSEQFRDVVFLSEAMASAEF